MHGVILAIMSAFFFGFMPILAKLAFTHGATVVTVLFFRFFFSAVLLLIYFLIKKINFTLKTRQLKKIFFLGFIWYNITCLTLFLSYKYIAAGFATVLHFIYPIVVTFLACLIYKERLYLHKAVALIISIIGVYILAGFSMANVNIIGVILALASGVFYGIYILEVGHNELKDIDSLVLTFYVSAFSVAGVLPFGVLTKTLVLNLNAYAYLYMFTIAVLCTLGALVAFNRAIQIIGPSNSAILSTLEPITSMVLGALLLDEQITLATLIGSVLILYSVYLIIKPHKKESRLPRRSYYEKN